MRRLTCCFLLVFVFGRLSSQEFISGLTADYNSGIGERYTYGIGLQVEMSLGKKKNWYLNWHYSLGSNTHGEFYARAPISVMLYKTDYLWDSHPRDLGELFGILLGPLFCPNGVTYYLPRRYGQNHRFGLYCNPLVLDYWDMSPYKVESWTLEGGVKFHWYISNERLLYIAGGVSCTNNIKRGNRWFGNETLVGIQIGLLGYGD